MITRYSDHAANERTFLAWVRTAIAMMAFGFVIERLGVAIIAIAGWRFVQTAKDIDSESEVASPGERFDLALSGMVGLLGAALFLYLSHAVLPFM